MNYRYGRDKEYLIQNMLQSEGYYTIRSAGSHTAVDIVALHKEKQKVVLLQVKSTKDFKSAVTYLRQGYEEISEAPAIYERRVVVFVKGKIAFDISLSDKHELEIKTERKTHKFYAVPNVCVLPHSVSNTHTKKEVFSNAER